MLFKSHKSIRWLLTATVLFMIHTSAYAQATRTWVSGVGDDANPCSRTAPCKTFAGAISKTAAGGEIDTLDPGGFGGVTITKAMTLYSDDSKNGGILVAGTNGIIVNCVSDPNCIVVIRGVNINGGPIGANSLAGIKFLAGGELHVENCHISQFTVASNGYGIYFTPSSGIGKLYVDGSTIEANGNVGSGGGIYVFPGASASANVEITNSHISGNYGNGVRADDRTQVTISGSDVSGNVNNGILAVTTGANANIFVKSSSVSENASGFPASAAGVQAKGGANAVIHISDDVITHNAYGVKPNTGGLVISYGNNEIVNNTTDGAPSSVVAQQ